MRILFVHQNYPAQFGHVARHLVSKHGWDCKFVSLLPPKVDNGIERIQYGFQGGATSRTHYCGRSFENAIWHTHAVYEALKLRPDIKPDLIVGHSGFGSTLFLRELYPDARLVNYFEYFYHPTNSDVDFRPDFPVAEIDRLRVRARNAMLLLDLENCDSGYSPTHWQKSRFPSAYQDKISVLFDGIDTTIWKPQSVPHRRVGSYQFPEGMKIVTYATRGMEAMRGFDVFMKFAKRLAAVRSDVIFVVVGQDRICYGGDEKVIGGKSFKEWVLKQDDYDLSRFVFTGLLPPGELAKLFAISDLHVYLTVPFVLSWSLLNALACGALVLASDTEPVREVIRHGVNGLLCNFFDYQEMVKMAEKVLTNPNLYTEIRKKSIDSAISHYGIDVCIEKISEHFRQLAKK
jgi:glycosyltransferase involved in cell wall biosynthesis